MDTESGVLLALTLGFLLGLKHATDADHVVAVSTIVSESRNIWRGLWIGGSWGLGHTTPLLVLGVIILLFKEAVLDRYESIAPFLELGVALMLVLLGIQVFWKIRSGRIHLHQHFHSKGPHVHIHSSHDPSATPDVESSHSILHIGKPEFRMKSFTIGMVHGLAGSAAVMLVLLPQIGSFWVGFGYLLLFGLGTVLSMSAITLVFSVPLSFSNRFRNMNVTLAGLAGLASIALGGFMIYNIAL